ncbi:beta-ketoacyl-[acyl-carrier-protein] synthase family protein [Thermodesulfobacteriota bacterium]
MGTAHFRRAVITGIGVITSVGESLPSFEKGIFSGKSGIRPITVFDASGFACHSAGQVEEPDLKGRLPFDNLRRASRCDLLGLIAAHEAVMDSGINRENPDPGDVGVIMGGGAGGMLSWEIYRRAQKSKDKRPRPSTLLASAPCTLTDLIAGIFGFKGTRATITTACSSSATSIGYGCDLIRSGTHEFVITGGSEALSELTFAGFNSLRLVDPEYCRPFDMERKGLSLGEGAAILVLEEYEHALQRGVAIYAEVMGYGINADAYHMTSPDPEGLGMGRAMEMALEDSGVHKEQIHYINAHGTGTKVNDGTETAAIKRVFGKQKAEELRISSTKSMVGHCLGAAGAVEAAATILAIVRQSAPPTIHLKNPDPECDLNYVSGGSEPCEIRTAMSNSFAFGGNNTSVVFGRIARK